MLRRIRAALPACQGLSNRFSFRPQDRDAIFIITNNTLHPVNRIQVQSAISDVEPERERPESPSEIGRWGRNALAYFFGTTPVVSERQNAQPPPAASRNGTQSQDHTSLQIQGGDDSRNELVIIPRSRRNRTQGEREDELEDIGDNSEAQREVPPGANLPTAAVKKQIKLHSTPTFLKVHFDILYYIGISPINGDGKRGSPFQLVAFIIATLLAMLFAFGRCKLFIVNHAKTGDLQDYITAWFYISSLILQLGFLWLVVFSYSEVSDILQEAKTSRPGIRYKTNQGNKNISLLSVTFASLGIIQAVVETVKLEFLASGDIATMQEYISSHSHDTSLLLFLWGKGANGTDNSQILYMRYSKDVTASTMAMGFLGMAMTFFGILQEIAIKDILLMTALHTFRLGQIFGSNISQLCQEKQPNDQLTSLLSSVHSQLSDTTGKIDACFGNFFKVVHADNLLSWAYVLAYILDGEVSGVFVFHTMVNILKITYILYCPAHAIKTSQEVKSVIRKKYCIKDYPNDMTVMTLQNVFLLIQTLEDNPISMGSDNFLMDETFSLKFVGTVVTFFLFLADTDKNMQRRRRR